MPDTLLFAQYMVDWKLFAADSANFTCINEGPAYRTRSKMALTNEDVVMIEDNYWQYLLLDSYCKQIND